MKTNRTAQPIAHKRPPQAVAFAVGDDPKSATLSIRGTIGDWFDGKNAEQVEWELDWLPATIENLTIRITSMGGRLDHGLAIQNALMRHPAHKVVVIEGVAASAATIVAMAGHERHIHVNAAMMIHGVSFVDEDGNDLDMPEAERVMNEAMIETYAAATGKSRDELLAAMAQDTWMTGREAVEAGWADTLIELEPAQAQAETVMALACAAGVPQEVIARAMATPEVTPEPEPSEGGDPPAASSDDDPAPEPVATFAAQVNALAVAAGLGDFVGAWLLDGKLTDVAQAQAAIAEAREVRDLCTFAGQPAAAAQFIRKRVSLADARAQLINAVADASDQHAIDHHPSSTSKPPRSAAPAAVSTARIWAQRRTPTH